MTNGTGYLVAILLELREGKVYRETLYWSEPFEALAWRAAFLERLPGA